jgi:hypothetical protein
MNAKASVIDTINTILRPAHLTAWSAGAILAGALILSLVFGRRGGRSIPAERNGPPARSSVWAAFLALGAVAAAFVWAEARHAPAAVVPEPAPPRTEVIRQTVTKVVSHSPLNGWEIVIIAVVLAGSCVAIWVNRRGN